MRALKRVVMLKENREPSNFTWLWRGGMKSLTEYIWDFTFYFLDFGSKQLSYKSVRIYAKFSGNPSDTFWQRLRAKNDRREACGRPSAQSSRQRQLHVPAWI